ncbi:MAG TPA: methyltransferase domain-containing protein [Miltoncostaeaceae bacterium]|jgi:ubiquinone/menaquinone biosynthesis C-methylase UbiE|nr:methyltransferase domain-containing protein [Miltoncostaeaceae bacterium]
MATPEEYRAASREVWDRMAAGWDRRRDWMWEASQAVGQWMVDALAPRPGQTILELAAGLGDTGFAAAAALGGEGRLISTDFSAEMVEAARRHAAELGIGNSEHRTMDAERIDLEDASVDGALCRWGYMLMADPAAALRETGRVLRDGGRLAMSVWGDPERNPWASVPARIIMDRAGAPPPDPEAPGIFAMASERRTRSLLEDAGLEVRRMEVIEVEWSFASADDVWTFVRDLAGALALVLKAMPEPDQSEVRSTLTDALEPYRNGAGYTMPGAALNALAVA